MASSSSSSAFDDDDDPLSDVFGAMNQSSPIAPSRAEKHALTARSSERKRLKPEQVAAADAFLHDPAAIREVKLFMHLMVLENQIDKIQNIANYAAAVLLSSKIRTYKGTVPTDILLEILKIRRFDLPAGIEHNPADFAKVNSAVQEALTQKRSKFKKLIKHSLKPNDPKSADNAPPAERLNIFQLDQAFVAGTQCSVNVPLCARVALMRKSYLKYPGPDFWNKVDKDLAAIRKKAEGDSRKITKAFRHILTTDQELHGSKDYDIAQENVDGFQQEVDYVIDANIFDAATTATATTAAEATTSTAPATAAA
ncbi:hypothetical protein B0H10DRAFT_1946671 [Mycena sp. CBHHK59/15]|nr:hypothetical protein B0H10DRAFT_1946671 [Mycena sp. CBHHK59/15]